MKYFEKVDKDLINNRALNSHEKLIYIICKSFENAPRGCRISHKYLMKSKLYMVKLSLMFTY